MKVLRMSLPIVESLSRLQESIFSLFRGPQLNSHGKSKNWSNFIDVRSTAADPEKLESWIAVKLDSWMAGQLTCCNGDSGCQNMDVLMASVSLNLS